MTKLEQISVHDRLRHFGVCLGKAAYTLGLAFVASGMSFFTLIIFTFLLLMLIPHSSIKEVLLLEFFLGCLFGTWYACSHERSCWGRWVCFLLYLGMAYFYLDSWFIERTFWESIRAPLHLVFLCLSVVVFYVGDYGEACKRDNASNEESLRMRLFHGRHWARRWELHKRRSQRKKLKTAKARKPRRNPFLALRRKAQDNNTNDTVHPDSPHES